MSAGLGSLCHDSVSAAALHELCKGYGSYHRDYDDACILPHFHVLAGVSGSRRYDLDAFLHDNLCHIVCVGAHQHDVDAERLLCQFLCLTDLFSYHLARRAGCAD